MFTVLSVPSMLSLEMSGPAKGMQPISADIAGVKRDYLDARRESLEWSRAQAVTKIIDFWLAIGAPPLNELDALKAIIPIPADAKVPLIPAWAKFAGKHPPASLPVRG